MFPPLSFTSSSLVKASKFLDILLTWKTISFFTASKYPFGYDLATSSNPGNANNLSAALFIITSALFPNAINSVAFFSVTLIVDFVPDFVSNLPRV